MNKVERQTAISLLESQDAANDNVHAGKWMQDNARLVEKYVTDYTAVTDDEKATLVYALNADVQVRDYAMGLLKPEQLEAYNHLLSWTPPTKWQSAQACLVSQIHYESGNKDEAIKTIKIARPNYPLAQLLRRVYTAGWDSKVFQQMREELHPQVVAVIFGDGEAA